MKIIMKIIIYNILISVLISYFTIFTLASYNLPKHGHLWQLCSFPPNVGKTRINHPQFHHKQLGFQPFPNGLFICFTPMIFL